MTEVPATIMYASQVSRETVRIALMITTLNDLVVKSGDIMNAYVKAHHRDGVDYFGPEFSKNARKTAVIVRALYGQKPAEAAFRSHLAGAWSPWV